MKFAKSIAAPTTATNLADLLATTELQVNEVIIQAPAGNAANLYIGNHIAQPGYIIPNGSMTLNIRNLKETYLIGTSGDFVIILVP